MTCPTCLQGATSTHRLQVFEGHLHSKALFLEKVGGFLKMSLDFRLLGCFHAQRSHPLNFIAMEMDVHRYPHPLTDDPMNKIFYFLNQNKTYLNL